MKKRLRWVISTDRDLFHSEIHRIFIFHFSPTQITSARNTRISLCRGAGAAQTIFTFARARYWRSGVDALSIWNKREWRKTRISVNEICYVCTVHLIVCEVFLSSARAYHPPSRNRDWFIENGIELCSAVCRELNWTECNYSVSINLW